MTVLDRATWTARSALHQAEVHALLDPYFDLRKRGESHPVVDFLFTYYRLSPAQLLRWHPGFGVVLEDAPEYASQRGYTTVDAGVTADPAFLGRRLDTIRYVGQLLETTAARPPAFGCFGLHEWAMVYRTSDVRHSKVPLRLGAGTDAVVESLPLRCTHFDAFRFFTEPAVPRNPTLLARDTQIEHEQPGCLHAGMDVYRFTSKLLPLVDSDLLWLAFVLAYDARDLDMRASPYDLSAYGYEPVRIETPQGRADYVREQSALTERAEPIRARLIERCRTLAGINVDTSTV
ncbi:hypothetical protein [Smaragdicoccus niigatensis]|uniref:hypothetical protein n=1 Tax=Smaragdicoccus niigatensis TaxID=359359 RepID=UPI00035FC476|nr:hypothetical protein [Smaragdicoccus niigatensis]